MRPFDEAQRDLILVAIAVADELAREAAAYRIQGGQELQGLTGETARRLRQAVASYRDAAIDLAVEAAGGRDGEP